MLLSLIYKYNFYYLHQNPMNYVGATSSVERHLKPLSEEEITERKKEALKQGWIIIDIKIYRETRSGNSKC